MSDIPIRCAYSVAVDPSSLRPHPLNPNNHPPAQIALFCEILRFQGWRRPITVSLRSGFITKGHGALMAAQALGLTSVPIDEQEYETEAAELADLVADNQLPRMAELEVGKLQTIMTHLGEQATPFDLKLTGFTNESLAELKLGLPAAGDGSGGDGAGDDSYTRKIAAPIYEIKGEKPAAASLVDASKVDELLDEIDAAKLPPDVREFLERAAQRHAVFNYESIAEYYAHAPKEVQALMEKSALVIIDFDKAIENGFVALSEKLAEAYQDDEA